MSEPAIEPRLRDGLRTCLATFLGLRIGLVVLAVVAVGVIPARPGVGVPGWPAAPFGHGWHAAFTGLVREDALWFLRIATSGYRAADGSPAFFPLYPLAIKLVSWLVGGHPLLAATLVSNAAFFFALLVLYDLTVREFSEPVARRTIVYLAVFPTAFFYLAPYSESLFLLLSVLAFRQARRDRWVTAAIAGALAAFTRSIGIVLVPALLLMAVERCRENGGRLWPRIVGSLAVSLGPITYLALWGIVGGNAFAPIRAEENWDRQISSPLLSLWRGVEMGLGMLGRTDPAYWLIDVLVTGVVIAAVVWGWRRLSPPYLVYAWLSLLMPLSDPFPDRPLLSVPRFVAVLFPGRMGSGGRVRRRRLYEPWVLATFAAVRRHALRPLFELAVRLLREGRSPPRADRPARVMRARNDRTVGMGRYGDREEGVTIKVAIADDHSLVRQGLRRYLDMADGIDVVGEASNGVELLALVEKEDPDIALVDIRMPEMDGLEAAREIRDKHPKVGVIMLTAYDDRQFVVEAVRSGARGYVLKARDAEHLIQTVRLVAGGNMVIDPQLVVALAEELSTAKERDRKAETLTAREIEVLQLLAFGHTNRDIAERLYISPDTVKTHLEHIFEKLGASDRTAAVAEALRRRLIE